MAEPEIQKTGPRIDALDYVRALAIIHIFMYHYYLEWFHGSFLMEPNGIAANIERLTVFHDGGILGFIKNLFSFLFVYGFTSVNLFLLLSGFVLTYSFAKSGEFSVFKKGRDWARYFWKRFKRLLIPFYISVLIGIGFLYIRNVLFPALGGDPLFGVTDLAKLIFVPLLFFDIPFVQLFNGDYWFIPLILQLYLLFPVLYWLLKRLGVPKFLVLAFILSVAFRWYAAYFLSSVPMGVLYPAENSYRLFSFFLPRLFEFSFGMGLAMLFHGSHDFLDRFRGPLPFVFGFICMFGGFSLNMYQWGWAFSDPVMSVGLFTVTLNLGCALSRRKFMRKMLKFISHSSYETYLLHHYFLNYFLVPLLVTLGLFGNEAVFWMVMPLFFISSILLGAGGQRLTALAEKIRVRKADR